MEQKCTTYMYSKIVCLPQTSEYTIRKFIYVNDYFENQIALQRNYQLVFHARKKKVHGFTITKRMR